MFRIPISFAALLLSAGLWSAYGQTPAAGSVEGQVVDAASGTPLGSATVELGFNIGKPNRTGQPAAPRQSTAQADGQGRFAFRNLEAGLYTLNARSPGYLMGPAGTPPAQFILGEQQALQGLRLKLTAQGAISGKILGRDGQPLSGAIVTALRRQFVQGHEQWAPVYSAPSNERGEYRLDGVAPGRYRISAAPGGYIPTTYPNPVAVSAGGSVAADLQVRTTPTVRIRCRIVDVDNKPANGVPVLTPKDGGSTPLYGAALPEGQFEFQGVPAGQYFLTARGNGGPLPLTAAKAITVADKNLDDVVLQLAPPRDVKGTVQLESGGAFDSSYMTIVANSLDGFGNAVAVKGSGPNEFILHNVPAGRTTLTLYPPYNAYVKSAQYGGKDLTPAGVDITTGDKLSLLLSTDGASLAGHVLAAAGKPAARAVLALVSAGEFEQTTADFNGEFRFRMLRPGEYTLYAWNAADAAFALDPETLSQFEREARAVKLEAGRTATVTLATIADAPAGPLEIPRAKATLAGTIANAKTGEPISNAVVRLTPAGLGSTIAASSPYTSNGPAISAQTDGQGRFVLSGVDSGAYQLSAGRSGFLNAIYGMRRDNTADALIVGEGQAVQGLSLRLMPQFVISVRVTDEGGDPVPGAKVVLYERDAARGFLALKEGLTGPRGEFRFDSLAAGTFFVSAHPEPPLAPAEAEFLPAPDFPEQRYITTYYPDSLRASGARPIVLAGNATTVQAEIKVRRTTTFEIRGSFSGMPAAGTPGGTPFGSIPQPPAVRLYPKDEINTFLPGAGTVVSHPSGVFAIFDVPPGSYLLVARTYPFDPNHLFGAGQTIEIKDKHLIGLDVALKPGGEVRAHVVWAQPSTVRLAGMYARMASVYPTGSQSPGVFSESDATFTFRSILPQPYRVEVTNLPANCNCYVQSIRYGGREVPEGGTDFTTGEPLEIVLGVNPGMVDGAVVDTEGVPVGGVSVELVAKTGRRLAATTGQNGSFRMAAVPPGEYRAIAGDDEAGAVAVTVDPGGRHSLRIVAGSR